VLPRDQAASARTVEILERTKKLSQLRDRLTEAEQAPSLVLVHGYESRVSVVSASRVVREANRQPTVDRPGASSPLGRRGRADARFETRCRDRRARVAHGPGRLARPQREHADTLPSLRLSLQRPDSPVATDAELVALLSKAELRSTERLGPLFVPSPPPERASGRHTRATGFRQTGPCFARVGHRGSTRTSAGWVFFDAPSRVAAAQSVACSAWPTGRSSGFSSCRSRRRCRCPCR
jgi:hypothetical protein